MFFVIVGWVIFRSANCVEAMQYLCEMFAFSTGQYTVFSFIGVRKLVVLLLAMILATPVYKRIEKKNWFWVETAIQFVILIISIMLIISGTYNPFIYFEF
jgi:alginate O-acetyltransferase complex protein AlgI